MTVKLEYKRVMDLLPMPQGKTEEVDLGAKGVRDLFEDIKSNKFTGFVTFSSQQLLSRGFFIMYKGKCIGCTFSSAVRNLQDSIKDSIAQAIDDIKAGGSLVINKCSMPPHIVLPLSAAYQGSNEENKADISEGKSLSDIMEWFKESKSTGIVVITSELGNCYNFYFEGIYKGTFNPEAKEIILDENAAFSFQEHSESATLQPILLAKNLLQDEAQFGHDLTSFLA